MQIAIWSISNLLKTFGRHSMASRLDTKRCTRRIKAMKNVTLLALLLLSALVPARAQNTAKTEDPEAAYTKTITERADKIVATLGITDSAKATRVRDLIAGQYRNLRAIHDPRDAQIKVAKEKSKENKAAA